MIVSHENGEMEKIDFYTKKAKTIYPIISGEVSTVNVI